MRLLPFILLLSFLHMGLRPAMAFPKCEKAVQQWEEDAVAEIEDEDENGNEDGDSKTLKDLLFFLHIPRTGGRTYHFCLLRHLYKGSELCDRSYDELRFNKSQHCKLLATHDDYSVTEKLPKHQFSVVTIMRHPLERVLSTYEFSMEVAARFLTKRALPSVLRRQRARRRNAATSTLDVWPWKHLVPWMRDDLYQHERRWPDTTALHDVNPYDSPFLTMPLREFINAPLAMDLVHNGATFQIAGITNNSYFKENGKLRDCIRKYPNLGYHVLNVAKRRLEKMLLVGLTESHKDTAMMFAHMVAKQAMLRIESNSSLLAPFTATVPREGSESSKNQESLQQKNVTNISSLENSTSSLNSTLWQQPTMDGLLSTYKTCDGSLRGTQISRRINSLKNIPLVNFSNEARSRISEDVRKKILELNYLDTELYKYAQILFNKQRELMRNVSNPEEVKVSSMHQLSEFEGRGFVHNPFQNIGMIMMMSLAAGVSTMVMSIALLLLRRKRRRSNVLFGAHRKTHRKV